MRNGGGTEEDGMALLVFKGPLLLYLELWNGQLRDFTEVVLDAGNLGFEVLEGDGAVPLGGDRHEPVLGHGEVWMEDGKSGERMCRGGDKCVRDERMGNRDLFCHEYNESALPSQQKSRLLLFDS